MTLSPMQRLFLCLAAVLFLLGPNGVFVYYALFRWNDFVAAMGNPGTRVLMAEAFLVMGLLAWFFAWRPLGRWGWKTFVVLSLVGGLGFGIPAFIVLNSQIKEP